MPRKMIRYSDELRRQLVELVWAGRNPVDLAREFEPTAQTIREWVARADRDVASEIKPSTARPGDLRRLRRAVDKVRQERDILARAAREVDPEDGPPGTFHFMEVNKADFPIRTMARVLGVSTSGYYAWKTRPPSARELADRELSAHVREIHEQSGGAYGAPRIQAALVKMGYRIGRQRVARLMREAGLRGKGGYQGPSTPDAPAASPDAEAPTIHILGPRAQRLFTLRRS